MGQDWRGGCSSIQVGGRSLGKNGEDGREAVQQPRVRLSGSSMSSRQKDVRAGTGSQADLGSSPELTLRWPSDCAKQLSMTRSVSSSVRSGS